MFDPSWYDYEEFVDRLGESLFGQIKEELDPTEYLLWVDRPAPPRAVSIPFIPVIFVSVVAGLSGFSLAAMFGLVNQTWLDPRTIAVSLGLAPAVLGGLIFAHLVSRGIRAWAKRRRLARLVYLVTDHRAIVARITYPEGVLLALSLWRGTAASTRSFENPDGSGDLYFLGEEDDDWLPFDFIDVPQVGLVERLARETLIDTEPWGGQPDWSGTC